MSICWMKQDTGMKNEFGEIPMGYFSEADYEA
jgi:hypothetical protein